MRLLPAAVIFIGVLAVMTADEFRTGKDVSEDHIKLWLGATIVFGVFGVLGIIFR